MLEVQYVNIFCQGRKRLGPGPPSAQVGLTFTRVGNNGGVRGRLVEPFGADGDVCVRYLFVAIAVDLVPGIVIFRKEKKTPAGILADLD